MTKRPQLIWPAVILGVILLVIAAIYWIDDAGSLPSFFPGHEAGSTHHHFKHGLAAAILAVACFVFAWFQTGAPAPEGGPSEG
jgi:amino acid transporter